MGETLWKVFPAFRTPIFFAPKSPHDFSSRLTLPTRVALRSRGRPQTSPPLARSCRLRRARWVGMGAAMGRGPQRTSEDSRGSTRRARGGLARDIK